MAVGTSTAFRNLLQAMSVSGVTTHLDYPPGQIHASDLPVLFLMPPSVEMTDRLSSCVADSRSRTRTIVICLQAVTLDAAEINYDLIDPMIDNLETALHTTLNNVSYFYDYTMNSGEYNVAGISYWALFCTVSIRSSY